MGNIFSAERVCPSRDLSTSCNLAIFSNAASLSQDQKLSPNNDLAGSNVRDYDASSF